MTLKKRHFTLIELLVVMGLIGLLVSLAVPSFTRLAKGKAVPAAADQIKRQLEEAQALAIANRSYVGLVIINGDPADYNSITSDSDDLAAAPDLYALASTRPAFLAREQTLDNNGDIQNEYYFEKWAPDSSWSKPIENARIVEVTDDYDGRIPTEGEKYAPPNLNTSKNTLTTSHVLTKTGKSGGKSPLCDMVAPSGKLSASCIAFNPDGGLDSSSDVFFLISGCTASGTTLTFASDNTDYMILHINRFSGKIVYFTKP